eukprot:scaffold210506_cov52-Cyclotella_meneghiniana.AAC.1
MPTNEEKSTTFAFAEPSPAMSLISSFLILTRGLRIRLMQPFHFNFYAKIPPPCMADSRLFSVSDTFPGDGQPQAPAIQTAPPINSRTRQQPSTVTNEQPRRVITTDAHARVMCNSTSPLPVSVKTAGTTLVVVVAQVLPPLTTIQRYSDSARYRRPST